MSRGFVGRDTQVLYLQAAFFPSEKDSTTIKKCASMEATRCDQKWSLRLLVGMVIIRIS